eukprot:1155627-Amphidinium_carterae.1
MSYCVVHVDDIIVLGAHQERDRVMSTLRSEYKLKHEFPCSKTGDRVKLLGRWLLKTQRGFALCNDAKYAAQLQTLVGLSSESKGCLVPLTANDRDQPKGEELSLKEHEDFRRAVGQLLWLAADRPDLRFAVTLLASA